MFGVGWEELAVEWRLVGRSKRLPKEWVFTIWFEDVVGRVLVVPMSLWVL